jgi:hypothetical protein
VRCACGGTGALCGIDAAYVLFLGATQEVLLLVEHMTCLTRNLQSRNVDNVMLRHDCEGVVKLIHSLHDGRIEAAKVRPGL